MFDGIVSSHAPSIYGMREVKEAIALQLFGGVSKVLPDGVRLRGDIHVLLVGDPSLAKSQSLSLRYVAQIAPRGVYASGTGASGAGLTAAVVKDDWGGGRWSLEAGAMVLADQGHLMLDELEKMNDRDRQRMHDALEAHGPGVGAEGDARALPRSDRARGSPEARSPGATGPRSRPRARQPRGPWGRSGRVGASGCAPSSASSAP